jgi:hypothetical protein
MFWRSIPTWLFSATHIGGVTLTMAADLTNQVIQCDQAKCQKKHPHYADQLIFH